MIRVASKIAPAEDETCNPWRWSCRFTSAKIFSRLRLFLNHTHNKSVDKTITYYSLIFFNIIH
jgi:hypothetical protein